jgi:hypothetical protein
MRHTPSILALASPLWLLQGKIRQLRYFAILPRHIAIPLRPPRRQFGLTQN